MNEDLLTHLADVPMSTHQPELASIERRSRAIRRARHSRRLSIIGAGAAVLVAGGVFWPTTTTPHGTVAAGGPLAFGALPAAADSDDANCAAGFGSWVSRDDWAASPEIVASASLITASPLPLASIGVHQEEANCPRSVPAAVFYSTDPVRGISVWPDVADPFEGATDLSSQTVRGQAGQVRSFDGEGMQLSWVDADGIRWLALGSGVDKTTFVSVVDGLVFEGHDGQTLDPTSAPPGFVSVDVIEPSDTTLTRSWQVQYGDESFVESNVRGKFVSLQATTSPREPVAVVASIYASGTRLAEVDGELAVLAYNGPVHSGRAVLTWQKDGVTYNLSSDGTVDEAVALANSVEQVSVTDPRVSGAPEYPLD